MKITILFTIVASLAACGGVSEPDNQKTSLPVKTEQTGSRDTVITFENINEFTQTFTGKKQILDWKIINSNGNNVVEQTAKNEGDYYNLLVMNDPTYKNFTLSVKIRANGGYEDQGGGLVWRYVDNNNYYIARCNPLENNFRFYKVVKGNRIKLNSVDCNIKSGEWFTMTVTMNGNKITCSLNGNKMIEATDDTYSNAGRVGLWTKADAQSYFDDLTIQPVK